jgi:hypothetical protein
MPITPASLPYPFIPSFLHNEANNCDISNVMLISVNPDETFIGATNITLLCGTHTESVRLTKSTTYRQLVFSIPLSSFSESGYYHFFYVLTGPKGFLRYSPACRLLIDFDAGMDHLPPLFTLGGEKTHIITRRHLTTQGLVVYLMSSHEFEMGDKLSLEWQGYDISGVMLLNSLFTREHTLGKSDINRRILFFIPKESLSLINFGRAHLSYRLKKRNGSLHFSKPTDVLVNLTTNRCLPAPKLPEANGGLLCDYRVLGYGGAMVVIPLYWQMQVGDRVTLYWKGYTLAGQSIPGSDVVAQTTVTTRDFIREFCFIISTAELEKISVGAAKVFYTVHSHASGKELLSAVTDVAIDMVHY